VLPGNPIKNRKKKRSKKKSFCENGRFSYTCGHTTRFEYVKRVSFKFLSTHSGILTTKHRSNWNKIMFSLYWRHADICKDRWSCTPPEIQPDSNTRAVVELKSGSDAGRLSTVSIFSNIWAFLYYFFFLKRNARDGRYKIILLYWRNHWQSP